MPTPGEPGSDRARDRATDRPAQVTDRPAQATAALTVGELGERGVLARVLARLGQADSAAVGPGDDCAVLTVTGELVITTDTMIEGPDFRLAWHDGFRLGWKLAATNLSDVAAMGAQPTALTLALAVPRATPVQFLEEIAAGLDAACRALAPGCGVVGGDLGTAQQLVAAVTAVGQLDGETPVLRSGARPGDVVAYCGDLGLAGLGLSLLFARAADAAGVATADPLPELWESHAAVLSAQLAPSPPIQLGRAASGTATAMLDVSDGLALDAARIAVASDVVIAFDVALLRAGFGAQQGVAVSINAMLHGGEDHGLLATFPGDAEIPVGFTVIGEVRPAVACQTERDRVLLDEVPVSVTGWDPYVVTWPGD